MAMTNPYDPQDDSGAAPTPGITDQINSYLGNPQAQSALLNFGLALMQPPSFGDTAASQIGRAIGGAGQALRTQEEEQKKDAIAQQQADAKSDVAAARAEAAGARAGAGADRLLLQRNMLDSLNDRNRLNNQVRLSGMYQQYVRDVSGRNAKQKANADLLGTPFQPEPVLPFTGWVQQNPMLKNLGLMGDQGAAGGSQPPGSNDVQDYPTAPLNPADRADGMTYQTPRGNLTWHAGQGWGPPQ